MQFSSISDFPRGWKCSFHQFLTFQGVGNAVFGNFWLSKGLEAQFSSISNFPRGWKRSFRQFLTFQGVGNAENGRFCVSLTSDGQFLDDSAFRSRATASFWMILRFAYERRPVFCVFPSVAPVSFISGSVVGGRLRG